jgi:hypothetical protein
MLFLQLEINCDYYIKNFRKRIMITSSLLPYALRLTPGSSLSHHASRITHGVSALCLTPGFQKKGPVLADAAPVVAEKLT